MGLKNRNVFEELKLAIMQGIYRPRERLLESALAAKFGTSRTPIREAFRKLESMGFLRIVPNQGATVNDFSAEDIQLLYLVRIKNEQLAAKLACARITPEEIQKLKDINDEFIEAVRRNNIPAMIEKDQEFHLAINRYCGNPFLAKLIEDLRAFSYQYMFYYWKEKKVTARSVMMHKEILKALSSHDVRQTGALVAAHLSAVKKHYIKHIAQH